MRSDDQHTEDQFHDHMSRVRKILLRFHSNEISVIEKRRAIAAENAVYYGDNFRSPMTGELLTKPPRIQNYEPLF